ncbi:hypothetical protein [Myroides odoratus]|uniref:hypothetical protein n=1 Tax=Myroides odoratus TaxID=256 RepID=UPI0039AF7DBB
MIIEPVSVHYTFKNKFKTFIGGDLGTTISAKNPYDEDEPGMTLFAESIKFFDFSLFFGGGYKLTDKIDINLKYNLGLTNINDSKEENAKKWRKNYLTLSMGYTFR